MISCLRVTVVLGQNDQFRKSSFCICFPQGVLTPLRFLDLAAQLRSAVSLHMRLAGPLHKPASYELAEQVRRALQLAAGLSARSERAQQLRAELRKSCQLSS